VAKKIKYYTRKSSNSTGQKINKLQWWHSHSVQENLLGLSKWQLFVLHVSYPQEIWSVTSGCRMIFFLHDDLHWDNRFLGSKMKLKLNKNGFLSRLQSAVTLSNPIHPLSAIHTHGTAEGGDQ
jgi:hypothetical protein